MSDVHREKNRGVASTTLSHLTTMARNLGGLRVGKALDEMGEAGFGFVMLFLALPALIPIPGPFGLVFGSALAIVALQFALGRKNLWLPSLLAERTISVSALESLERYAGPIVSRIEKVVRPNRMTILTGRRIPYLLSVPIFALAVAIALPIPFGNLVPVIAICVMAVGLIERDGLAVLVGLLLSAVALGATWALLHGATALVTSA